MERGNFRKTCRDFKEAKLTLRNNIDDESYKLFMFLLHIKNLLKIKYTHSF